MSLLDEKAVDREPRSETDFAQGRIDVSSAPTGKPSNGWNAFCLRIFGPKESVALELEEQRLSHGLRKMLMVVIFLLFLASLFYTVWYGVLEHGYPPSAYECCPYEWYAYYGRVVAGVVVMILCLRGMVKLAIREKKPEQEAIPLEVLKQLTKSVSA